VCVCVCPVPTCNCEMCCLCHMFAYPHKMQWECVCKCQNALWIVDVCVRCLVYVCKPLLENVKADVCVSSEYSGRWECVCVIVYQQECIGNMCVCVRLTCLCV